MNELLLKLLPWYLLAMLLVGGGAWWHGHHTGYDTASVKMQSKIDKLNTQIAQERETASEAARLAERKHSAEMATAYGNYQENLKNAKADSDRLVADLRAGSVRLRDHWNTCVAASVLPGIAGSAGPPDADTELRAAHQGQVFEDVAGQVRDSAEADATIRALQAIVKADRAATEKKQ